MKEGSIEPRWHGYDALRALMMILGVFLHASYTYSVHFPGYVNEQDSSLTFDIILLFLHVFRMPVFFAMAGFFTVLVISRKGLEAWFRDRTRRILLPFLFCYAVLSPLMTMLIDALSGKATASSMFSDVAEMIVLKGQLYHYWFLYFLFTYSLIWYLYQRYGPSWLRQADAKVVRMMEGLAGSPLRLAGSGTVISFLLMMKERSGYLSYSPFLAPVLKVYVYYLFYFYVGTLMYRTRFELQAGLGQWRKMLLLAIPTTMMYVMMVLSSLVKGSSSWWMTNLANALLCWLMLLGSTGFCLEKFGSERKWIRRWANAGYWIYLVHFPLVLVLAELLVDIHMPLMMKFLIVSAVTIAMGYWSYLYLVRGRAIGRFLFGARSATRPAEKALSLREAAT